MGRGSEGRVPAGRAPEVHFPGLNGLRFVAALAVIVTHVELLKGQLGHANSWQNPAIQGAGVLGVYLFFVLSGFLITYLLLTEKQVVGRIGIKKFYIRRICRIWPLYYLLTFAAFFLLPRITFLHVPSWQAHLQNGFTVKLLLFIGMLPNLANAMYPAVPHASQTWSIGVEEQFYLFWPWLLSYSRNTLRAMIVVSLGILAIKAIVLLLLATYPDSRPLFVLKEFVAMSKLECMSIGGMSAWALYHKRSAVLNAVYARGTQLAAFALIPLLIFFTPDFLENGSHILYSVCFAVIILNVATNERSLLRLNGRVIDYLGRISYGLYMYHVVAVVFVLKVVAMTIAPSGLLFNLLVYSGAVALTVAVAALSYHFFERPFLELKRNFQPALPRVDALSR